MKIKALIFDMNGVIQLRDGLNKELLDYMTGLKSDYTIAVLTTMNRNNYTALMYLVPEELIRYSFTADDMFERKPHEDAFINTAKGIGVKPEECIMIDDSFYNIEGAERAGMKGLVYVDFKEMKTALDGLLSKS